MMAKGYKGIGMEGPIARWYAASNGRAPDRYDDQVVKVREYARPGAEILEVAPGPGYLSIFKNFSDPAGALREMRRVLRPGGHGFILDLRRDPSKQAVDADVARMGLGTVSRAFTRFALRSFLPRRAYTKAQFEGLLASAGCTSYDIGQSPLTLEVEFRA